MFKNTLVIGLALLASCQEAPAPDTDANGVANEVEDRPADVNQPRDFRAIGLIDLDLDGDPDVTDPDNDGDGISDLVELQNDADCDGVADGEITDPLDSDGDGLADYKDTDSDDDGIPDAIESDGACPEGPDFDADGTPDRLDDTDDTVVVDPDSDGNCVLDSIEGTQDTDSDGDGDHIDPDNDGDGLIDDYEIGDCAAPVDSDGDGVPDYKDTDSDDNGVPDAIENLPDTGPVYNVVIDFTNLGQFDQDGDGVLDDGKCWFNGTEIALTGLFQVDGLTPGAWYGLLCQDPASTWTVITGIEIVATCADVGNPGMGHCAYIEAQ